MIDKELLIDACDKLFESELGQKIESNIRETISLYQMDEYIRKGTVVGLSGGSDSVLLLIFFWKLQKETKFDLKAVHVNHLIRGSDADYDENFSKEFSSALGIDFISVKRDIPALAKETKCGIEEAARNVRYQVFENLVNKSDTIKTIATAHNSTDNLETFIFNFMRGTGITGLSGIAPVRGNIVRPLLNVSKKDILKLLTDANIPFVTDKTNFSTDYSRNYIRHEILPKLNRLAAFPEEMATNAIRNLRTDADCINEIANDFYFSNYRDGKIEASKLRELHKAVFARILRKLANEKTDSVPEKVHIDKIYQLLSEKKNFEFDIPGAVSFVCKDKYCCILRKHEKSKVSDIEYLLHDGFNEIPELNLAIAISDDKNEDFSSNVYKFSIQADISSAIIVGELRLRNKKDGDSYFYGGMTRKVKKLFCDKKIPLEKRDKIPVITDDKGIVWVMGFGVRNDSPKNKKHKWITVWEKTT